MKIKKEYIILVLIIVALSLYLILRDRDRTHYQLPILPQIADKNISKIEIVTPDATISLKEKDKKWYLEPQGFPANTARVKNMLDTIQELTITALVSKSKNYSRYNLDDSNKITVKAWTGDRVAREFVVGKAASSFRHTFVRLAGDDRVYHARGNFTGTFDQTVDKLRDNTVLAFERNDIVEIQVRKDEQALTFVRTEVPQEVGADDKADDEPSPSTAGETIWQTPDGDQGDKSQMERLLSALSDLQCEKYIDGQQKEDFSNPIYTMRLKGAQEHTLSVFAKANEDATSYPAVSSGSDYPFMLPEWQVNSLMKQPADMLKKEDPPATPTE